MQNILGCIDFSLMKFYLIEDFDINLEMPHAFIVKHSNSMSITYFSN